MLKCLRATTTKNDYIIYRHEDDVRLCAVGTHTHTHTQRCRSAKIYCVFPMSHCQNVEIKILISLNGNWKTEQMVH